MRLEFIHPVYLPPLSESFLRKDFNFSAYLGFAFGKTLQNFFNTNWIGLLIIFVLTELYKLLYFTNNEWWGTLINLMVPLFFLIIFILFYLQFKNI